MQVGSTESNIDCSCYFSENFFTRSPIEAHFSYHGKAEFEQEHAQLLDSLVESERAKLLANLEAEAKRRRSQAAQAAERKSRIAAEYAPLCVA